MNTNNISTRNFVPMANKYDRVVLLVDMDCFYCQVEEKLDPSLKNKPLAVVQYNAWRGGGIIAVNYAARAKGVTRHMRGDEAKEQCPDIQLVKVPNIREKADLSKYREAGKEVANVLQRFTPLLERASVDEAYLDITEAVNKRLQEMNDGIFILQPQELVNTYAVGFPTIGEFVTTITSSFINNEVANDDPFYRNFSENDIPAVRQSNIRLLIGASIASEIRNAVKAETSYECSAGIAHNKILAKLACGINKPNKQTILPLAQIPVLFETLPIGKIKGLGAKFGEEVCDRLNVRYLGQLLKFTESELQKKFDEKNGSWLYNICRGIDLEAVTPRFYSKSIGCCKKFPGRNNITGLKTLQHWLNELADEINERLEKDILENNRRAKQMVVNFIQEVNGEEVSSSRSAPLQSYETDVLVKISLEIIKSNTKQFFRSGSESALNNPIKFLGISVGKFETISNSQNNIQEMFAQQAAKKQKLKNDNEVIKQNSISLSENSQSSNTASMHLWKNESENNLDKKYLTKDKNSPNVKSFFLKALKKDVPNKINKSNESDRDSDMYKKLKPSSERSEKTSYQKNKTQNKLNSEDKKCVVDDKPIPKTSFFSRALKKTEDISKQSKVYPNESDIVSNGNVSINLNNRDTSCNELDELINDINDIKNKDNECNLQLQKENENSFINNSITNTQNHSIFNLTDLPEKTKNSQTNLKRKFEQITDNAETEQRLDYRSQYAEFAIPEFRPEYLQFTNCSKCGAKILNDPVSIQTHEDHHFAQELSQQQRNEFRDEFRSKFNSSKSPPSNEKNKKVKKVQQNSSVKKVLAADITKFLKPSIFSPSYSDPSLPKNNDPNVEMCNICKLSIPIGEILEHKDFHMAKNLQRQLNQLEVHTVEIVKKSAPETSRKSMNTSTIAASRQNKIAAKPITQFFTQPNVQ
ncbi:DNA polymerase eta [Cochliomyia hominivorax]